MTYNTDVLLKYCTFPESVHTTKLYYCYSSENCCDVGCCSNTTLRIYQVWYFWVLLLIIFCAFSGGSWYCRSPRSRTCRAEGRSISPPRRSPFRGTARGSPYLRDLPRISTGAAAYLGNLTDDDSIVLDHFFLSFRSRTAAGDPPSYSTVMSSAEYKDLPSYSALSEPPPRYSSVTILKQGGEREDDASTSVDVHRSMSNSAGLQERPEESSSTDPGREREDSNH